MGNYMPLGSSSSSETMENRTIEGEYMDIVNRNAWPMVYQRIGQRCQAYPYTWKEAKKPQNRALNRYRDVNPYDHSRVVLQRCESDYINANYVKLERANRRYILTQGPLPGTVGHFWLMVWEQNSRAILMLNKVVEKREVKCYDYWPHKVGEDHKMEFDDVKLSVELIEEESFSQYVIRTFKVVDLETSTTREVYHYHYTTWPDFGVPNCPATFLTFLMQVRKSGVLDSALGPPIVHCSAGIGRSGTFCLVDSCLVIIEKEGLDYLDIQEILLELRRDRMGLIQTPDQLRFSYQAVIEGAKRLDPDWDDEDYGEAAIKEEVTYDKLPDEQAPPPPPRAESLTRAPGRPLPPIPASESLGDLLSVSQDQVSTSSEEDDTPVHSAVEVSLSASSADDENEELELPIPLVGSPTIDLADTLRRRRNRELAERVSVMKKRAREAERWHQIKRCRMEGEEKSRQD